MYAPLPYGVCMAAGIINWIDSHGILHKGCTIM